MAVTVRDNPEKMNVIQAIFNEDLTALTKSRLDGIIQGIGLLLHSTGKYKVVVIDLFPEPDSSKLESHYSYYLWLVIFSNSSNAAFFVDD